MNGEMNGEMIGISGRFTSVAPSRSNEIIYEKYKDDFDRFARDLLNNGEIEIKIKDEYYKFAAYIEAVTKPELTKIGSFGNWEAILKILL